MKTLARSILALALCGAPLNSHASRSFVRASSQSLDATGSVLVSALPMTISIWFRPSNLTDLQNLVIVNNSSLTDTGCYIVYRADQAGKPLGAVNRHADTSFGEADLNSGFSSGVWAHCAGVFSSASSRSVFVNGSKATNTTSSTPPTAMQSIHVGHYATAVSYCDGQLAELGIWNVALTDDEITALARGLSPLRVRPSALVNYYPLIGNGTENGAKGSPLSNTGTTHADTHPRIYR